MMGVDRALEATGYWRRGAYSGNRIRPVRKCRVLQSGARLIYYIFVNAFVRCISSTVQRHCPFHPTDQTFGIAVVP